jgi:hypothetical protein
MRELRKDELAGLWQLTEAALAEQRTLGPIVSFLASSLILVKTGDGAGLALNEVHTYAED